MTRQRWLMLIVAVLLVIIIAGIGLILMKKINGTVTTADRVQTGSPTATQTQIVASATPSPSAIPTSTTSAATSTISSTNTSTSAPFPTATPTTPGLIKSLIPTKIRIPAINVSAVVEQVGVAKDGNMDVPKNNTDTAWFKDGYQPGQPGNAVIAGHLDGYGTTQAVFWDLNKLKQGDKIYLSDDSNQELTFEVVTNEVFPYNNAPLRRIFGPADTSNLNLITCAGTFDQATQNYKDRQVIFAKLVK